MNSFSLSVVSPPPALELDWLLEISVLATAAKGSSRPHARSERLAHILTASINHLGCALGALIMPQRHLRLVQVSRRANPLAEDAFRCLEVPCLNAIQRTGAPLLCNQGRTRGASSLPAVRLMVVPVGNVTIAPGALFLLRSPDDPEFTSLHLSVARHLGHLFSNFLDADLDLATGLYTRLGLQQYLETSESNPTEAPDSHAVICIDIDRLHVVNEVGGFEAGDALIARVAQLLREPPVPSGAAAARISGNEFALLLPNAGTDVAQVTARSLQRLAECLASEVSPQHPISLSCGIASFGPPAEFQRGLVLAELACIMFEVTETVALLSLTKAVRFMEELSAIGCRFALDDFGTGANSHENLVSLPVDRVKIDGSFVSDILTNHESAAIVRAIVTLARDLGINTVAEYAETEQIIQRLRELGVENAQGYGIDAPRSAARVFADLQTYHRRKLLELSANRGPGGR